MADPLSPEAIAAAVDRMAAAIDGDPVALIGIRRGGLLVADALAVSLCARGRRVERGSLDISFYRDDLDTIGPNPEVRASELPFDISGRTLWLVDDVLQSGRTVRAALGELFDYGRPAAIRLAVLIDRGGRQLPIQPDLVGIRHSLDGRTAIDLSRTDDGVWQARLRRIGARRGA